MANNGFQIPRPEHPRPDFRRDTWMNLNGTWEFGYHDTHFIHDDAQGLAQPLEYKIEVPYVYQSELSGIHTGEIHSCIWYRREFVLPDEWKGKRIFLHFGAVDYSAEVWWNKKPVGVHQGGHVPFQFEILDGRIGESNTIDVKVFDTTSTSQPRGKQSWSSPFLCWYTAVSGIWQTVWLEGVSDIHIDSIETATDYDNSRVQFQIRPSGISQGIDIEAVVTFHGREIGAKTLALTYPITSIDFSIPDFRDWSIGEPNLYDVRFRLKKDDSVLDEVTSYFGIRKIGLDAKGLILNNEPCFQKLILDQGYWPDGLYTAPTDDDFRRDIELAKAMGFNGCRKHMKIEDPRFLYWADRLGFLVWEECPAFYEYTAEARERFMAEWMASIQRDRIHPSIVAWVPFNESWGIPDIKDKLEVQAWVKNVVAMTRLVDPTRLVMDNDGWEHVESDIYGFHSYALPGKPLMADVDAYVKGKAAPTNGKKLMVKGLSAEDFPLMLTEFGGIAFTDKNSHTEAWGYEGTPPNKQAFIQRYEHLFQTIQEISNICGWVYTQLTDVEQESNGLLYADRTPKFDIEWLLSIHSNTGE